MRALPALAFAAAAACGNRPPAAIPATDPMATAPPAPPIDTTPTAPARPVITQSLAAIGLDPTALDRSADPCDDFYQFACGSWIQRTQIAADQPEAMRSFVAITDRNLDYAHDLLEHLRANPPSDRPTQQLAAFYASCMDEPSIERIGLAPIWPWLELIDKVHDVRSLTTVLATIHSTGIDPVFRLGAVQDAADARSVIAHIDQAGLVLPDRDYYLTTDDAAVNMRAALQAFAETVLTALGHPAARREAADVLALETALAKVSIDKVAHRDPHATYNRLDRAGVAKAMPHLDWDAYWAVVGVPGVTRITVDAPGFLAGVDPLLASVKPATWRAYLALHVVSESTAMLPRALEDAGFKLESAITGQPEMAPRWKRCVQQTETALGNLVGQAFVRDRFAGDSKAAAEDAVHAIAAAMTANLDALPWMDATTKAHARQKLDAMTYQIGYPRKWRTYRFITDVRTWTTNAFAARRFERARQLAKIDHPLDRDDWQMETTDVNAYYDDQLNGMVFPAGILQAPLYSVTAAIPVNLGAIGMTVGHELTHGFDDQGAQYDAAGNLVNWWQPDTAAQFKQRTQCVIDQYAAYEVAGGTRLNGANTLGENIADIGGVKLAFAAYRALRAEATDSVVADGFTEDQQFFLGFGQAWCAKQRPDYERYLATVDVHAPARWRVNGTVSATPEFARAFHCRVGARMAPAHPCVVW